MTLSEVPKEIAEFEKTGGTFLLKKIGQKRENYMVPIGTDVTGSLSTRVVNGEIRVNVGAGLTDYISTSPIVKIVEASEKVVVFETVGGLYWLERVKNG